MKKDVLLKEVIFERNFVLMWIAMLISTIGTYVLLLALSSKVYLETHSSIAASMIFAAQWAAPILTFALIGKIANNGSSRIRLATIDFCSAVVSIFLIFFWPKYKIIVFGFLIIRGFLEALTKTLRDTSLKRLSLPSHLEKAASFFNTSYFIGIAIGALVSSLLVETFTLTQIAILDSMTFVVSGVLYFFIDESNYLSTRSKNFLSDKQNELSNGLKLVFKDKKLLNSFLSLVIIVGVFQGFHNLARSALPIDVLKLSEINLQRFQLCFTLGVITGALFVGKFLQQNSSLTFRPIIYTVITAIFMSCACLSPIPVLSFIFYFIYAFLFEICFTKFKNALFLNTPGHQIGYVMAFLQVSLTSILTVSILFFGGFTDYFGLTPVAIIMGMAAFVGIVFINKFCKESNL